MPKLTELDATIIRNLLRDGRMSYDELAAKCGVSKNIVWKRCRGMDKKGIITGATTQVNFSHLGFDALATLLISVNSQQLEHVMKFIEKIPDVRAYRQYSSVYNVRAFAKLRDLNELDHVKQVIKQTLPTINLKTYIWTGVRNTPENLNLTGTQKVDNADDKRHFSKQATELETQKPLDRLDKQIVTRLTLDGRESFTEIAKQLGVSTETVIKRYQRLRRKGTVKVLIQINPKLIGFNAVLDFNVAFTAPGGLSNTVVESLAEIPNILIMTKTSGDYDIQGTAMIRDISESFFLQEQIARIGGVTKIDASTRRIPDSWPTQEQYISTF
jgi:DNA-binding Lrp family transcriptional regulator